jgi:iron complex transport system ATP-binding protein
VTGAPRRDARREPPAVAVRGKPPVAAVRGVSVVRDGRPILHDVEWRVGAGERWALLGPNGSGKTTLLKVVGLQLLPTTGVVETLGERAGRTDMRAARRRIAFVSQAILRDLRPSLSSHDVVLTGRYAALEPSWHDYDDADHRRAAELLADAGLADAADRQFGLLSEGERQRVLLARALMGRPELLLLDEPAAGLDLGAREQLVRQLAALATDPTVPPVVLVTHHTEEIPPGTTHAALMRRGTIAAQGPVAEVLVPALVSEAFEVPVAIDAHEDRWFARADVSRLHDLADFARKP